MSGLQRLFQKKIAVLFVLGLLIAACSPDPADRPGTVAGEHSAARSVFLGTPFAPDGPLAALRAESRYAWRRLRWQVKKWLGHDRLGPPPVVANAAHYPRNVWDMQLWQGKIYLGHGNSSNREPALNAGPVPVVYYDPADGRFAAEFVVDEEQIDRFRLIDGLLYIPGHDPRESWDWGNFYRRDPEGWKKMRTLPRVIHTYDLLAFRDTLFAANGTTQGGAVARSADGGQTWTSFPIPGTPRAYELFELAGALYVSAYKSRIYRYQG
ncbi:MAG: hypothetical protein QGH25_22100, partial [Candidatus Latescibacteria bacterium]|nr:hypothetical protein [Candidatus Latescibacterota bacterium]